MSLSKGEKLNQRVWMLFKEAGFDTKPNLTDPAEYIIDVGRGRPVDLYAELPELGVKIIGSNKSGRISGGTWTGHMSDCDNLRKKILAQKCLLVATDHELDVADMAYANGISMPVWTEDDLLYYEELVASIGIYAKYEIINSLGINTKEECDIHKVLAIKLNQPTTNGSIELFTFSMSPERLLRTSVIYRKAQGNANAYQRMLRRDRLPDIAKFLSTKEAILPTDIILHFNDSVAVKPINIKNILDSSGNPIPFSNVNNYTPVELDIPMRYASMEIIDGQHRLFGFVHTHDDIRKNFNLVVIGIKNLSEKQKRETFVAINDNSRRMDANLVSYLKYTTDETLCQNDQNLMAIKVVVDMNKQSPFKKLIKLLDVGKEKLTLKGLSGYDLRALLGKKGYLRKYNITNHSDEYVRMLRIYFSLLKDAFKSEWKDPNRYIIVTNRGITAMLKLLKSILKNEDSWPSEEKFKEYIGAMKKHWKGGWEINKLKSSYIGGQGWADFHRDIVTAIKKEKRFKNFRR